MTDEELKKLIFAGVEVRARITQEKLEADIKNVVQIDLESEKASKAYVKVAKELARRLSERGLNDAETFSYDDLSPLEQSAVEMVRNDSNRDIEHLKGDYVISSFLEREKVWRGGKPPLKRLQLSDKQLKTIFMLKAQKKSIREITRLLALNRKTITKVLNKEYANKADVERIENAERNVGYQTDIFDYLP